MRGALTKAVVDFLEKSKNRRFNQLGLRGSIPNKPSLSYFPTITDTKYSKNSKNSSRYSSSCGRIDYT